LNLLKDVVAKILWAIFLSGISKNLQNYLKFKLFELVGKDFGNGKNIFQMFFQKFCVFLF